MRTCHIAIAAIIGVALILCLRKKEKYQYLGDSAMPLNSRVLKNAISDGADDCDNCIQKDSTYSYIQSQM